MDLDLFMAVLGLCCCGGFSLVAMGSPLIAGHPPWCGAGALGCMGFRGWSTGLSSSGSGLSSTGSTAVAHRLPCSEVARGIFLDQGWTSGRWFFTSEPTGTPLNFLKWFYILRASLVAQMRKNPPTVQETRVWSLGREDPLEKGMAAHSSLLAWRIPWTEEPGQAIVYRVAKSWTQPSDFHLHFNVHFENLKKTFQKFYLNVSDTHFMIKSDSFPLGSSLGTSFQTFSCASRISYLLSPQKGWILCVSRGLYTKWLLCTFP